MNNSVSTAVSVNIENNGAWSSMMLVFQLPNHVDVDSFVSGFQDMLQHFLQSDLKDKMPADAIVMAVIATMQCQMPFEFLATKADTVVIHKTN